MSPLIVIVGPTASGKSALALHLAKLLGSEIVGADSRQIYRGMDVGTGKETAEERRGVAHHMVDVVDPDSPWSLAEYQKQASTANDDIASRGGIPLLVGGTGLYVQCIVDGLLLPAVAPQPELRAALQLRADRDGGSALFAELVRLDPDARSFIDGRNVRRVIRALEVIDVTGRPFSSFRRGGVPLQPRPLVIGLSAERSVLHRRADLRVEAMFARGLVEEVARLMARYDLSMPAFSAVGYREVGGLIRGTASLSWTKEAVKRSTHQYQKRQLTWFRRMDGVRWMDIEAIDVATASERIAADYPPR